VQEIGPYLNKLILKVKLQMPLSRAIDLVYATREYERKLMTLIIKRNM
jgi:hypothetical protein